MNLNAPPPARSEAEAWASYVKRLLFAAALVIAIALVVKLADVLLLIFGAALVSVLLNAIAEPLRNHTPLGRTASVVTAVLITAAVIALAVWAFGREFERQVSSLADLLPRAWTAVKGQLSQSMLGRLLLGELDRVPGPNGGWLSLAPRLAAGAATTAATTTIVTFAGLYLAFHPQTYANGLVRLFPRSMRARTHALMGSMYDALKRWLLGQVLSMLLVGGTTTLGLWLVGVPSPIGLGVLAGVGQFVPVVGPMAATLPGLLVALAAGPQTFALAGGVYLASSQLEANVFTPLVLRQMVELPMAVTLFAVLAMGMLLGPLGVFLATPLAVVAYVLVKSVYVEGMLGDTDVAAEPTPP